MRKAVKISLLKNLNTMYEAHRVLSELLNKKKYEDAQILLNECQQTAIELGTAIECSEGVEFPTVKLLEEYCEALYEISVNINDLKGVKAFRQLNHALDNVEKSAKNDILVRSEAVFMPYKASMWDSLESVWKAAVNDPTCDPYVVPIPYYDRNPDGFFGKFHYEGDDYPQNVPVMHYEEYDLEERCPDTIYIHCPYDNCNYVTSVDPRFYSSELKKYTDCLVYIPYYLANGSISKAMAMTPAYLSADYIITQSERYRKYFDANIPDEKFLPLGSPKIDAVLEACGKNQTLPAGWEEKIAGKRVLFYNTTITQALENTRMFFKKLMYVFHSFMEYGDHACLLWRPHPLLESTIDSMRPEYKKEYLRLKQFFIEKGIGIYDDNPDITLSIAISDGYMGDAYSSVVTDFLAVGKPVFVMSDLYDQMPEAVDRSKMLVSYIGDIYSLTAHPETKWVVIRGSRLFYSEKDDFSYASFANLGDNESYLSGVIQVGEKCYVTPKCASDLVIFNRGGIEKRVRLKQYDEIGGRLFAGAVADEQNLFLIPVCYPSVVKYDTQTGNITYLSDRLKEVSGRPDSRVFRSCCIHEGVLYLSAYACNKIWAYNIKTGKILVHELELASVRGFMKMYSDKEWLWLLPNKGDAVIKWNPTNYVTVEYSCAHLGIHCYDYANDNCRIMNLFSSAYFYGEYVYLAPGAGDMFVKVNKVTGEVLEWRTGIDLSAVAHNCYSECYYHKSWFLPTDVPEKCRLVSAVEGKIYDIDLNCDATKCRKVNFDSEQIQEIMSGFVYEPIYGQYCCLEDEYNSLKDYIENTFHYNKFDRDRQMEYVSLISNNIDGSAGRRIYEATKQS